VKVALTKPLKATAVAPVSSCRDGHAGPCRPAVGAKLVIVGGGTTVNAALLVAVPRGVVTLSGPVVAPAGTVAWIVVSEVTVKVRSRC